MAVRVLLLLAALAFMVFTTEAFAPLPSGTTLSSRASSALASCRTNAKKEKIKRNRENMRKFKSGGKRGTSRRKTLKKIQSSQARQEENEFIAKCFVTVPAPGSDD